MFPAAVDQARSLDNRIGDDLTKIKRGHGSRMRAGLLPSRKVGWWQDAALPPPEPNQIGYWIKVKEIQQSESYHAPRCDIHRHLRGSWSLARRNRPRR